MYINKHFGKIYLPLKNWIFSPLSAKNTIHVLILIIACFVVFDNINAQETRDDGTDSASQQNLLFKLTSSEEFTIIEETSSATPLYTTYNYLEDNEKTPYISKENVIESFIKEDVSTQFVATGDALVKPTITSTTSNIKLRDKSVEYTVLGGDTLSGIAEQFGINVTTLLWANNLTVRSYIKPGDTLTILPTNGITHTVKSGENLSAIANKYEGDTDRIIEFNKLVDASDIQVGQTLVIPGGVKPTPVTRSVATTTPSRVTNVTSPPTIYSSSAPSTTAPSSSTALVWPTSGHVVTQYYSWKHTGLDIDGHYDSPIYASEAGTVITAQGGWNGGYGLYIIIDHGNGLKTLYAHSSKIFVKVGDTVSRGQTIAMVGTTGRSTGTHLHYEVRKNGVRVNPFQYFK